MSYPTLEQYQEALQHPRSAFIDPRLKNGTIHSSGLGLPVVVSGGFALTYSVESQGMRNAVRCFHREAPGLELRYAAISNTLKKLASPYFVDFEFQPQGIRINDKVYPIVKMAWASGETLGEFVENNYTNKTALTNLLNSLTQLSSYLSSQGIAHGDIQEGNLMVADQGRTIQLIDYDGMFVPSIAASGSSEMGHRDYQHPKRDSSVFNSSLDSFSFIVLNLALRALCEQPSLWQTTKSGAGVIVFRANDYAAPESSPVFSALGKVQALAGASQNLAAICRAPYAQIPSLSDFLQARNIPKQTTQTKGQRHTQQAAARYISQYPVLNASDYKAFSSHIGKMVELVGRIVEVKKDFTRRGRGSGRPYIFINFAPWRGPCVKISLWSEALEKGGIAPTSAWTNKWVTIKGLVEPIYHSKKYNYHHISISAASVGQLVLLTEAEALYRLNALPATTRTSTRSNSELLKSIRQEANSKTTRGTHAQTQISSNQHILATIKSKANNQPNTSQNSVTQRHTQVHSPKNYRTTPDDPPSSKSFSWWVWLLIILLLLYFFNK